MFIKNKKGVSEVVAYVLLISISFALAGMVFTWLKFYVTPHEEVVCDEGVSVIIRDFTYNCSASNLTLTIQNRGLFKTDGYTVRVNNRSGADIGVYTINRSGKALNTGEVQTISLFSNQTDVPAGQPLKIDGNLTFVEVQPFQIKQGNYTPYCTEAVGKYHLSCT